MAGVYEDAVREHRIRRWRKLRNKTFGQFGRLFGIQTPDRASEEQAGRIQEVMGLGFIWAEAVMVEWTGRQYTGEAVRWLQSIAEGRDRQTNSKTFSHLRPLIGRLLYREEGLGDFQIKRELAKAGIISPEHRSENGPALRTILDTARVILTLDERRHRGTFFSSNLPGL